LSVQARPIGLACFFIGHLMQYNVSLWRAQRSPFSRLCIESQ